MSPRVLVLLTFFFCVAVSAAEDRKVSVEIHSNERLISAAAAVLDGVSPTMRAELERLSGDRYRVTASFAVTERRPIVFFARGAEGRMVASKVVDPTGVRESEVPGVVRCGSESELLSSKRLLELSEEDRVALIAKREGELQNLSAELSALKTPARLQLLGEVGRRLAVTGGGEDLNDPEVLVREASRIESLLSQAAP